MKLPLHPLSSPFHTAQPVSMKVLFSLSHTPRLLHEGGLAAPDEEVEAGIDVEGAGVGVGVGDGAEPEPSTLMSAQFQNSSPKPRCTPQQEFWQFAQSAGHHGHQPEAPLQPAFGKVVLK
mmetsp:Transcript_47593/g.113113  ORF Transcript_47593/g.113113 Transcript_47593/m.113113 type:complete len:120 (+) Transcript_47593:444-803(+)